MDFRDIDPNAVRPRRVTPARAEDTDRWRPLGAAGRGLGAWHVRQGPRLRADPSTERTAADGAPAAVPEREIDVVVIGAGQAGLAAAHHLQRAGFLGYAPGLGRHVRGRSEDARTFVVLDDADGPGGAWQHRWRGLTMATVNDIQDLPGAALPATDPHEPARSAVTRYFTDYEDTFDLPVLRPVRVYSVERIDDAPSSRLRVVTSSGRWLARAVIAASGTWGRPFWPYVPGWRTFRGRSLHTRDYEGPEEFEGRRVAVVGGGVSAVGHLLEISQVARTRWFTRRPPAFRDTPFDAEAGRRVEASVRARTARGLRPRSVVSETGIPVTERIEEARRSGVLRARPMFTAIEPTGLREADGDVWRADVLVWATGFRPDLPYLHPLHLRTPAGGFRMEGTRIAGEPRVHLVGLGADSSTVGARRSARLAVAEVSQLLERSAATL